MERRLVLVTATIALKPLRGWPRARGTLNAADNRLPKQRPAWVESLSEARAARIIAERHLMKAIEQAELRYEQTAELGREFDRRLGRTKSRLRDAGYLGRDPLK
jgi:hypothetical protein